MSLWRASGWCYFPAGMVDLHWIEETFKINGHPGEERLGNTSCEFVLFPANGNGKNVCGAMQEGDKIIALLVGDPVLPFTEHPDFSSTYCLNLAGI